MRIFGHDLLACRLTHLIDVTFDMQTHVIIFNLHSQADVLNINQGRGWSFPHVSLSEKLVLVWLPLVPQLKWCGPACGLFWQEIGHFLWWLLWLQRMTLPCRNVDVHWISPSCDNLGLCTLRICQSFCCHPIFFQTSPVHCESSDSSDSTMGNGCQVWLPWLRISDCPMLEASEGPPCKTPGEEEQQTKVLYENEILTAFTHFSIIFFLFSESSGFLLGYRATANLFGPYGPDLCGRQLGRWCFFFAEHVRKPMISHDLSKWIIVLSLNMLIYLKTKIVVKEMGLDETWWDKTWIK